MERMSSERRKSFGAPNRHELEDDWSLGRKIIIFLSMLLVGFTFPFSLFFCLKVVKEYERAVLFRLGRVVEHSGGPGLVFIMPCVDKYQKVDLRLFTYNVPPQEILTKDSVTVNVDAVVYFRINSALLSVVNVTNADYSTQLLAQSTLRNILGTKTLSEILMDRVSIAHTIQDTLDEATERWGVKVERVEVKNVRLPEQLQRAMAAEAEATRNAKAEIIAAEGEHKASRALRAAADVMSQSKFALQLRYLQTASLIASEKNSTIIFPVPISLASLPVLGTAHLRSNSLQQPSQQRPLLSFAENLLPSIDENLTNQFHPTPNNNIFADQCCDDSP